MKKFLNVRNILIILIIVIGVLYIVFGRTKDSSKSKTLALAYTLGNKDIVTMKLTGVNDDKVESMIFSMDKKNNKLYQIIDSVDSSEEAKNYKSSHDKTITIRENGKVKSYQLNYDTKTYKEFEEQKDEKDITDWTDVFNKVPNESKYYTKGHETINGVKLITETFPENGYTFYFDENNNLKNIKQKDIFYGDKDVIYNVEISDNLIDESEATIPSDFTKKEETEKNIEE